LGAQIIKARQQFPNIILMINTAEALVFEEASKPFRRQRIKFPDLKKKEIIVKTLYSTVCKSDLHTFYGRRSSPSPSILGHEVIGEIIALGGDEITDYYGNPLKIADKITWSVYAYDKDSEISKKGFPQKSDNLFKYGHESIHSIIELSGGFSTHCHLIDGTTIIKVPNKLNYKESAPLNCTHATIAGAIRSAGEVWDKNVLVIGSGMLGLSACAMLREKGAKNVIAMDTNPYKLQQTRNFGANYLFESISGEFEHIFNKKIDVIIETSGNPEIIENSLLYLGIGGCMVLVGSVFPQRDISINAEKLVRSLLTIKGLHNYIPEDLAAAVEFMEEFHSKYPFSDLVSETFSLFDLEKAFEAGNNCQSYRIGIRY